MAIKKYHCDYCDKQFQDTPSDRKRHFSGIQHKQAKARWYDSFKQHPVPVPVPVPVPPTDPSSYCFHFVNMGFCRYGDSCKYFHPKAGSSNIHQQQQQTIISTGGDGMKMGVYTLWNNLPPSLQPPPEGQPGYPSHLPFVDWG